MGYTRYISKPSKITTEYKQNNKNCAKGVKKTKQKSNKYY